MVYHNLLATIFTFAIAFIWLRVNDKSAHLGWVSSSLSRKIIHMGTGPIYVLCWLLYEDDINARWLAALVPFAITMQFTLIGTGIIKDKAAVQAMSRSGDRREILRGPLFYGIAFVLLTLLYWKDSPIGIIALMLMCGGDGLAEVVGRKWGNAKLPWNRMKSWVGSISMLVGGWTFAFIIYTVFVFASVFNGPVYNKLPDITLIALSGMLVETLPVKDIDNLTVTATAVIVGHWLL